MRSMLLVLALLPAIAAFPALAGGKADTLTMTAKARVDVDAEGRVAKLEFLDARKMIPAVSEPLDRAIRSWEFEPARVEGRAVPSTTIVTVGVRAEPLGGEDAYVLRISSAESGPGVVDSTPPRYPVSAVRSGIEARVVLRVSIGPDGVPTAVETHEIELSRDRARVAEEIAEASRKAAAKWRFIPELVDGKPIASTVLMPVTFCIGRPGSRAPSCFADEAEALPDGSLLAEQPATRLRTEVIGTRL